ncbi:putative metalloprotease CJM1_0395 family protein [Lamprobacter modestohalophilus]|uniref:putative metalloprotease CJM1_0395 family protein n=1 Tax=Lamprobacter modestohalophilus TaxID=1064514 RepID=UPI0019031204
MITTTAASPLTSIAYVGKAANGGAASSPAAWRPSVEAAKTEAGPGQPERSAGEGTRARVSEGDASRNAQNNALAEELTPQELRILDQLKQTDREVRQHELAHQVAGGAYTGSAQFQYEIGPDGQRYAVAGEVSVDYGPVTGDPRATIEKMNVVISAALAPAEPSPTDYKVAARARQYLLMAQLELSQQQTQTGATNFIAEDAAANDDETTDAQLGRDRRVEEYSRIAATTGTSAETAQASLRSVA